MLLSCGAPDFINRTYRLDALSDNLPEATVAHGYPDVH